MDETVTARLVCALALLAPAGLAGAQGLVDPTRPPASLMAPAAGSTAPERSGAPQLQSILIARHPGGRHVAVIDGQTVRLGESYKGARLASMSETEVVLENGTRKQVLKLFPAVPSGAASLQR